MLHSPVSGYSPDFFILRIASWIGSGQMGILVGETRLDAGDQLRQEGKNVADSGE